MTTESFQLFPHGVVYAALIALLGWLAFVILAAGRFLWRAWTTRQPGGSRRADPAIER